MHGVKAALVKRGHEERSFPIEVDKNVFFYTDRMGDKGKVLITGLDDTTARAFYMGYHDNTWSSDQETVHMVIGNDRDSKEFASSQVLRDVCVRQLLSPDESMTIGQIASEMAAAPALGDAQ